jgi:Uma2 family endonuclease
MLGAERYRFTVEEFDRMAEAGVLAEDSRVELLAGEIIQMPPIGARHAGCVGMLTYLFAPLVACGDAWLETQNPVRLGQADEPNPDVLVARPRQDHYRIKRPTAADILLLVEVSDSTLRYDLTQKVPLYARAGVSDMWVVDLLHDRLLVHRDPSPDGYRTVTTLGRGDTVAPSSFPDHTLFVEDIQV